MHKSIWKLLELPRTDGQHLGRNFQSLYRHICLIGIRTQVANTWGEIFKVSTTYLFPCSTFPHFRTFVVLRFDMAGHCAYIANGKLWRRSASLLFLAVEWRLLTSNRAYGLCSFHTNARIAIGRLLRSCVECSAHIMYIVLEAV